MTSLGKCPPHKRLAIVVEANRRAEFQTALTIMEQENPTGFQEDLDWKLPGLQPWWQWSEAKFGNEPVTVSPMLPHRLFDFLHTNYPGHHRWRIVIGKTGMKKKHKRDWLRIRWIAVQFNGENDLVHFRAKWSGHD